MLSIAEEKILIGIFYDSETENNATCAHDTNTVMPTSPHLISFLLDSMSSLAKLENTINQFLGAYEIQLKNNCLVFRLTLKLALIS